MYLKFQHTAARRRLHAKGATSASSRSFNTQPREGGCLMDRFTDSTWIGFNTQPREGGCSRWAGKNIEFDVSTHSRAKAAA